ncbi:MAG: HDOD domain-containing protein [Planctomycetes bacterium]|nr:HDOD domain-containing protein [Planctomycetota bacterium]
MVARLTRENLRDLDNLPTLPSVVTRVLELVLDDSSSARDAAKIVESDQALSARVLKIVNSPAYGLRQKVSTVNHAIAMLGFTSLKSLVLSVSVYDGMIEGKQAGGGLDKIMYWQHCLATGAAARAIAREVGYDLPEEAFVAGLLHDIGKVILDLHDPAGFQDCLRTLRQEPVTTIESEVRHCGITHPEVGEWAAEHWHLPQILRDAIRHHHARNGDLPADLPVKHRHLAMIVTLADFVTWTQGMGSVEAKRPPLLDAAIQEEFHLPRLNLEAITEAVDAEMARMAEAYHMAVPDPKWFRAALQKANLELGRINSLYEEAKRHLETRVRELTELNEAIRKARQTLDVEGVRRAILTAIQQGLGFDRVIYFGFPESRDALQALDLKDSTNMALDPEQLRFPFGKDDPFLALCQSSHKPFRVNSSATETLGNTILKSLEAREMIAAPLKSSGKLAGLIVIDNALSGHPINAVSIESLGVLVAEAELAMENARLFQRTQDLATKDELTTVYNRRQVMLRLGEELARSRRYNRPLAIAMCDLDYFKKLNDTFGHLAGDQVLQEVARLIKTTSRDVDIVGRYGGEEFLCILPETDLEASIIYGERVRKAIELLGGLREAQYPNLQIAVSIGIAAFDPASDTTREALIDKADKALYAAKERGRNRVCVYR